MTACPNKTLMRCCRRKYIHKLIREGLITSLLVTQQGFFFYEAWAQTFSAPRSFRVGAAMPSARAAALGAQGIASVSLGNLNVRGPMNPEKWTVPGLMGPGPVQTPSAPEGVFVSGLPVQAAEALSAQMGPASGENAPKEQAVFFSDQKADALGAERRRGSLWEASPESSLPVRVSRFGRMVLGAAEIYFDRGRTLSASPVVPALGRMAGGPGRLRAAPASFKAGSEAEQTGSKYQFLKQLKAVLGEGLNHILNPFVFHPNGGGLAIGAPGTGLEGSLYGKLGIERDFGEDAVLAQWDDFFGYVYGLLAPFAWTADIQRALTDIRAMPHATADEARTRNHRLNEFLIETVKGLKNTLRQTDASQWGREMAIYPVLLRSHNKRKGRHDNVLDSLDEEELVRIHEVEKANVIYLVDLFEIGHIERWGKAGGSPFAIAKYRIQKELGGARAFRALRKRVDQLNKERGWNLKIMTNFVPNHYSLDAAKEHPKAFVHTVPTQPEPDENIEAYRQNILADVPRDPATGRALWYLLETRKYPEGGRKVRKFILVHHPYKAGDFFYWDMGQLDISRPEARALQIEAEKYLVSLGVNAFRRDMSDLVTNEFFFPHWQGLLQWERGTLPQDSRMRHALDDFLRDFEERRKALGGVEFLEQLSDATHEIDPAFVEIDESYHKQRAVRRAGSRGIYDKEGLYAAQAQAAVNPDRHRVAGWIREAMEYVAFLRWQDGTAPPLEFVGTFDGGEGNPVDKFGPLWAVAVANTLLLRPILMYYLELGLGREEMLIRDPGEVSEDDGKDPRKVFVKAIPWDVRALINWAKGHPGRQKFLHRVLETGERHRKLLRYGAMDVLRPRGASPIVAWTVAQEDAAGIQKALLVATNWSENTAQSTFEMGRPILDAFGAFKPKPGHVYIFRDLADLTDGQPATYRYTGDQLLSEGFPIKLAGVGVHIFEVEEL